ncbi:MAG: hypothetical protein HWN66_04210 [Candidatus Helarchaeota archaeon]|nr:hypothetical protein [Candidatus Helarchaeota archaeon]
MDTPTKYKRIFIFFILSVFIYSIIITFTIPHRWYYQNKWFTGFNGWEFGIILFGLFIILSKLYLLPPGENTLFREDPKNPPFRVRYALILHTLLTIFIFLFLFATQIIQTLVSRWDQLELGDPATSGFIRLIYEWCGGNKNAMYVFSAIPLFASILLMGFSISYILRTNTKNLRSALNVWGYSFIVGWIAATGWMYIAWFSLVNGDPTMWSALAKGNPWGYFGLGGWGVFFNNPVELTFMICMSLICSFIAYYVIFKKVQIQIEE